MAVGDYVFDKEQPPPTLIKALNYKNWGIGNIMQLPAGLLPQMNTVLFFYDALRGYQAAHMRTVQWTKDHPQQWEAVTLIISERRKRKRGNRTK